MLLALEQQVHVYSAYSYHDLGTGSSNNYAYLVVDDASKDAVIIDPAHPEEYEPASISSTTN